MNYWKNRIVKARFDLLNASIDATDIEIKKAYLHASKTVLNDMMRVYNKVMQEDEPLVSHLYQYNRYYEMLDQIDKRLELLGNKEERILTKNLTNLYINNQKILGPLGPLVNKESAERAIKEVWLTDGLNFSDRIWKDKKSLLANLENTMIEGVGTGKSADRLTADIIKNMSTSYSNANRLVRTEMAHASNKSAIDKYKADGIEYYRIISEPGCCNHCMDENNDIYLVVDTAHMPPFHPNCKCSVLAVVE